MSHGRKAVGPGSSLGSGKESIEYFARGSTPNFARQLTALVLDETNELAAGKQQARATRRRSTSSTGFAFNGDRLRSWLSRLRAELEVRMSTEITDALRREVASKAGKVRLDQVVGHPLLICR
jgi:hypothetical protein